MIDVQKQAGQRRLIASGAAALAQDHLVKPPAVGEAGQPVGRGQHGEFTPRLFELALRAAALGKHRRQDEDEEGCHDREHLNQNQTLVTVNPIETMVARKRPSVPPAKPQLTTTSTSGGKTRNSNG